jgi:BirA family biotin operon repressor/biotin-[acetyl-CoA-carboxylase] ligase
VARAVGERAEVDAVLKWPNDVLVRDRKLSGVLVEVPVPGAAVVGIGLNVTTRTDELATEAATSLGLEGAATTDRDTVLRAVLRALRDVLADPVGAREEYRALCATVGRSVVVRLPGDEAVTGTADAVDDDGRLVVGGVALGAGDVVHASLGAP